MVSETSGMALTARGQLYFYGVHTGHTPRHMTPSFGAGGEAYAVACRKERGQAAGSTPVPRPDRRAHRVTCCGYSQRMGLCLVGWTDGLVTAHAETNGEPYAILSKTPSTGTGGGGGEADPAGMGAGGSSGGHLGDVLLIRAWGGRDYVAADAHAAGGVDGEDFSGATVGVGGSEGWISVLRCMKGGYGPDWGNSQLMHCLLW